MNPIWPFSRRPREAKSALPLVAVTEIGAARWGSREGAALTRDGYLANAVAYRAVRMVAEAAASVPLVSAQAGAAQLIRRPQPGGVVEGYGLDGVHSVRAALEPLKLAYGFDCVERDGALVFRMADEGAVLDMAADALVETGAQRTRGLLDKAPARVRLTHVDLETDYQPGLAEARLAGGDPRLVQDVSLPLALGASRAEAVAGALLEAAASGESLGCELPLSALALEPGGAGVWRRGPGHHGCAAPARI